MTIEETQLIYTMEDNVFWVGSEGVFLVSEPDERMSTSELLLGDDSFIPHGEKEVFIF